MGIYRMPKIGKRMHAYYSVEGVEENMQLIMQRDKDVDQLIKVHGLSYNDSRAMDSDLRRYLYAKAFGSMSETQYRYDKHLYPHDDKGEDELLQVIAGPGVDINKYKPAPAEESTGVEDFMRLLDKDAVYRAEVAKKFPGLQNEALNQAIASERRLQEARERLENENYDYTKL